jgi:hypothetical protein
MAETWIQLVKRVFKENKAKDPNFKLGGAMKIAKKIYKKPTDVTTNKTAAKKMRTSRKSNKGTRKNRNT